MTAFDRFPRLIGAATLALSLATGTGLAQTPADAPTPLPILIGTGAVTGLYFPAGGAICRLLNGEQPAGRPACSIVASDGSVANLTALKAGDVDFALVQSDWQRMALTGEGRLAAMGPFTGLRAVLSLHAETLTILARPEAGITALADLKGKRINVGPSGSALRILADAALAPVGKMAAADLEELPPDAAVAALCDGKVDAAIFAVGHPNGAVREAVEGCAAVPVAIEGELQAKILADHPDFVAGRIPGRVYPGVEEDVATVGLVATLVTRADVPAPAVSRLVTTVLSRFEALQSQHPAFAFLRREDLPGLGRTAPLHPAAEAAFRDAGLLQ